MKLIHIEFDGFLFFIFKIAFLRKQYFQILKIGKGYRALVVKW